MKKLGIRSCFFKKRRKIRRPLLLTQKQLDMRNRGIAYRLNANEAIIFIFSKWLGLFCLVGAVVGMLLMFFGYFSGGLLGIPFLLIKIYEVI